MKEKRIRLLLFALTAVVFITALIAESVYFSDFEYRFLTKRFNRVLREKEKIMEECLLGMEPLLARGETLAPESESNVYTLAEENSITILEYIDNKLIYYSDNNFDVPRVLNDTVFAKPLVFMQNGWFMPKTLRAGNENIIGLLRISTDHGFENDIIKNGFEKDFGVPGNIGFSRDVNASAFHVTNSEDTFLFSLLYPENKTTTNFIILPLILWTLFIILLLILTVELVHYLISRNWKIMAFIPALLIFSAIYAVILFFKKPAVLIQTDLFSPYIYNMNKGVPTLGHLMMVSVLMALFSYIFLRYFPMKDTAAKIAGREYLFLTIMLIPGALLFLLFHQVFNHLIYNSNINFETFKVLNLNVFSIAGFTTLILLFLVPFFYLFKIFRNLRKVRTQTIMLSVLTSLAVFVIFMYKEPLSVIPLVLLYIFTSIVIWFSCNREPGFFNLNVFLSVVFALYSLYMITYLSEKKTTEKIKIQAVIYSTENDPEAEHLLLDLWDDISIDSVLGRMMKVRNFEKEDFDAISDYLHREYFTGYWGNFSLNIVLCRADDSLRVESRDGIYEDCFGFFNERITRYGHQLTGTDFYFIDNQQGRSNYLGYLYYTTGEYITNGLYIDLYSDIDVFQPGYPELLIDKKYHGYTRLKDYSFAKYVNGEIILMTGEFAYDKTDAEYIDRSTDYRLFKSEGFNHVLYRNGNITTVISRKRLTAGDYVISFAYLFIFIFITSALILIIVKPPALKNPRYFSFRQKLQLAFIGILLFSFALIGIVIASQAIRQFQTKHTENIKEKLNSVYIELENRISSEKALSSDWSSSEYSSLDIMLVELSNIFNTDINLYGRDGYLMATSRPEVFYRNLISQRMNILASNNLIYLTRSEFIHSEKIGNLEYISAYVPFYNSGNELLAYLNLPYFRMQSVLAREISNMIVAVINFMMLLIVVTMSIAVIISGRLTSPLMMLSRGLASVELGKKSEHLTYNGNDEVGELVKQYNRMVDELDESAKKLTDSERDYAWREMAKQIAHEIKNPLTPMKLNVQQLLKSWKDGVPGFEKKLERFTRNQIEYIDNLSSIATAFSSFAKMPGIRPVEVDLLDQVKTSLELFKNSDNITFRIGWPHESRVFIHADKEHLNGVFSNLVKNAIQSIPQGREGIVKINLEIRNDKVIVSVSDNGTGIPEGLKKKMFTPNFTTKSSGTGLGLSIVKRYVESANGRIWFESASDKGSTFFIEYPLLYTVEKMR